MIPLLVQAKATRVRLRRLKVWLGTTTLRRKPDGSLAENHRLMHSVGARPQSGRRRSITCNNPRINLSAENLPCRVVRKWLNRTFGSVATGPPGSEGTVATARHGQPEQTGNRPGPGGDHTRHQHRAANQAQRQAELAADRPDGRPEGARQRRSRQLAPWRFRKDRGRARPFHR